MKYRTLGTTGIKVSVVGIETHQWSGMGGRFFSVGDVRAILNRAEENGISFIDTGECYFFHTAERLIGEALGRNRKKFVIATKFGHKSEPKQIVPGWTGEGILKSLDDSLRALNSDYVDVFQAHINSKEDMKLFRKGLFEVSDALKTAKKSGKILHSGVCLGDDELFGEDGDILMQAVTEFGVEVVQVVYNRLNRAAEKSILLLARENNLGVIVRGPLAKGYLSSRFKPTNKNYDEKKMAEVEKIKKSELPPGADLAEWAIGWCIKNPVVSVVVPGCSTPEQIDSTVRALSHV